ncbi:---NA--- : [Gemmataceae bacterium]|nr:---NA--- : [Gemmataceae bacterium]VTT99058.1 ---NA--- : [Gemmataceae bacterium]
MPRKTESGHGPKKDRHKPSYQVRIPTAFVAGLEKMAALNGGDLPDEVRTAVREYLQKHGLWPTSVDETQPKR